MGVGVDEPPEQYQPPSQHPDGSASPLSEQYWPAGHALQSLTEDPRVKFLNVPTGQAYAVLKRKLTKEMKEHPLIHTHR